MTRSCEPSQLGHKDADFGQFSMSDNAWSPISKQASFVYSSIAAPSRSVAPSIFFPPYRYRRSASLSCAISSLDALFDGLLLHENMDCLRLL